MSKTNSRKSKQTKKPYRTDAASGNALNKIERKTERNWGVGRTLGGVVWEGLDWLINTAATTSHRLCNRHWISLFPCMTSLNPRTMFTLPICRWGSRGSKRLSNLSKVTHPLSGEIRT